MRRKRRDTKNFAYKRKDNNSFIFEEKIPVSLAAHRIRAAFTILFFSNVEGFKGCEKYISFLISLVWYPKRRKRRDTKSFAYKRKDNNSFIFEEKIPVSYAFKIFDFTKPVSLAEHTYCEAFFVKQGILVSFLRKKHAKLLFFRLKSSCFFLP